MFVFYSHIVVDHACFMNILYKTCKIISQCLIGINLLKNYIILYLILLYEYLPNITDYEYKLNIMTKTTRVLMSRHTIAGYAYFNSKY